MGNSKHKSNKISLLRLAATIKKFVLSSWQASQWRDSVSSKLFSSPAGSRHYEGLWVRNYSPSSSGLVIARLCEIENIIQSRRVSSLRGRHLKTDFNFSEEGRSNLNNYAAGNIITLMHDCYHLATILKFTKRGVKRLGIVNTLLAKSFISK